MGKGQVRVDATSAPPRRRSASGLGRRLSLLGAALALVATGCAAPTEIDERDDPELVDALTPPATNECRRLLASDLVLPSNAVRTVDCMTPHTAQTFEAGNLPGSLAEASYGDAAVTDFVRETCEPAFTELLGADESTRMRTVLSWVFFRPSPEAWEDGARWYRCDVVGGDVTFQKLMNLPATVEGLLSGRPKDKWVACAVGPTVAEGVRVPCSADHDWRAVTTIKVGGPDQPYPGDREVETTTRGFCSESVEAFLNYPDDFEYGYTWFGEDQWSTGNRRSVCWSKVEDDAPAESEEPRE